jgi:hypothetical protein
LHGLLNSNKKHLELLQPLKGDELREVVEQQRKAVGLQFEPELAKRILEDLEHEPGAMPLLQHCLRHLWNYRRGRNLRFVDYLDKDRVGGVKGAISRTADEVYIKLSLAEQQLCPFIFERLVRIDTEATDAEVRRDTRQREELSQLAPEGGDANLTKSIVTRLADAKLLVTTQNPQTKETEVEVAHEALIRHWGKLQDWIANARVTARLVERVRTAAGHYYGSQANPDNLTLQGVVLDEAETLLNTKPPRLTQTEATFVRRCRVKENEEKERELKNAQEREQLAIGRAEDANRAAEKQWRLTRWVIGVAIIALMSGGVAIYYQQESAQAAKSLSLELTESNRRLDLAKLREAEVAIERNDLNVARDLLDGVKEENRCIVWRYLNRKLAGSMFALYGHTDTVTSVVVTPDGQRIVTGSDDATARVWDARTGQALVELTGHTGRVMSVAVTPDGQRIVTGSDDKTARVWDARTGQALVQLKGHTREVTSVAVMPDGQRIVTGSYDRTVRVWDAGTGQVLVQLKGHTREVTSVAVMPDGQRIVSRSEDKTVRVWDQGERTSGGCVIRT